MGDKARLEDLAHPTVPGVNNDRGGQQDWGREEAPAQEDVLTSRGGAAGPAAVN